MFKVLTNQIVSKYNPQQILLFGSQTKRTVRKNSDIDLCIIINAPNKRKLLTDMYYSIETEKPIDILLYTPQEWEKCISDETSFAYKINTEGVKLHG